MTTTAQHTPETLLEGPLGAILIGSGTGFSVIEHPIAPRTLAAPSHVHQNEDEYSYVLEGEVGFEIGDQVLTAGPGQFVAKPRGIWHAFWNSGDRPARVLELIAPGGFEQYFAELAPLLPPARPEPDFEGLAALQARYGLTMDPSSIERLSREHALGSA
jgi:quercetin dioxygenase-like cupin family protein